MTALDGLPTFGIGISTSLNVTVPDFRRLRRERRELVDFVEFAVDHRDAETLASRLAPELAEGARFVVHPIEPSLDPVRRTSSGLSAPLASLLDDGLECEIAINELRQPDPAWPRCCTG